MTSTHPFNQLYFFIQDYKKQSGSKKIRMIYLWASRASIGILLYRVERFLYLLFGKFWQYTRVVFLPVLYPLYAYSNCEISYKANIGAGITILHPSMGVVVSAYATIGNDLTLTGGNVVGGRGGMKNKNFILGNNITVGANAVVLGPIVLGDNITIGASALVNKDFKSNSILVGVPAKNISKTVKKGSM